jgi:hypothetical protein
MPSQNFSHHENKASDSYGSGKEEVDALEADNDEEDNDVFPLFPGSADVDWGDMPDEEQDMEEEE